MCDYKMFISMKQVMMNLSCTFRTSQDNVMLHDQLNICQFTKFIRTLLKKCDIMLQTELQCSKMHHGMLGIVVEC